MSADVELAAFYASLLWNKQDTASTDFYKVARINSVSTQVLSGIVYTLNVTLIQTSCDKELIISQLQLSPADLDLCESESKQKICVFKLWLPINQEPVLRENKCDSIKNQAVSSKEENQLKPVEIDNELRYISYLASVKWNRLNNNTLSGGFYKLTDINNALKSAKETILNVTLTETYCSRQDILRKKNLVESELESCNVKSNGVNCLFSILHRRSVEHTHRFRLHNDSFEVKNCLNISIPLNETSTFTYFNQLPNGFHEVKFLSQKFFSFFRFFL